MEDGLAQPEGDRLPGGDPFPLSLFLFPRFFLIDLLSIALLT